MSESGGGRYFSGSSDAYRCVKDRAHAPGYSTKKVTVKGLDSYQKTGNEGCDGDGLCTRIIKKAL